MTYDELLYRGRLKVFQDYDTGRYTVSDICKRYGYSRTWFYKFKERRERLGNEGLRPMIRKLVTHNFSCGSVTKQLNLTILMVFKVSSYINKILLVFNFHLNFNIVDFKN